MSERLARLKFATPGEAIGKSIDLEGDTYTIVSVMPGDFYYPAASAQIWIPLATNGSPDRRVIGIGRLRTGKEWSEAAAELSAVARHESGPAAAIGWTIRPTPL